MVHYFYEISNKIEIYFAQENTSLHRYTRVKGKQGMRMIRSGYTISQLQVRKKELNFDFLKKTTRIMTPNYAK